MTIFSKTVENAYADTTVGVVEEATWHIVCVGDFGIRKLDRVPEFLTDSSKLLNLP
jgi:hypothetical protein